MKKHKHVCSPDTAQKIHTACNILIAALIIAALFIVPLVIDLFLQEDEADTLAPASASPLTLDIQLVNAANTKLPIHLGASVYLTEILSVSGHYPENGKDEQTENVLAIRVRNDADRTIEYLTVGLDCGAETYQFAISTLPPGETVLAYDKAQKAAPTSADEVQAEVGYLVFFAQEPSLLTDKLRITPQNGNIQVTNITDKDIASEFFVYYKNMVNDEFLGGITYRVRIADGLKAGETYNGYAANSSTARTRIMFADDAE